MLIGLAAKNAILIVEFAKMEYDKGKPVIEAALTGAKLRLRPILMTSFAFILGCVPLAIASGAGAISRRVMGWAVIGGMLAASFIAIFLIPVTFYVVEKLSHRGEKGTHNPLKRQKRRGKAMNKAIFSVLIVILLAGCAVGPDYKRPAIESPPAWRIEEKEAQETANTAWWHQFNDPVLNALIDEALKQNSDLTIATARIDEYVGRYWVGRSGLFPQIGVTAAGGTKPCLRGGSDSSLVAN